MLGTDFELVQKINFNPYYRTEHIGFIDMASNDYLGIRHHPMGVKAAVAMLEVYGLSQCGTPIACGYTELFASTRQRLSAFTGVENCMIFPSCYQANNGIFSLLCKGCDAIIFDHDCHSSLIQGIFASPAEKLPFRHNDMERLERILNKRCEKYEKIYVVTESVFSTEGAIAPFGEIIKLCEKYGAVPVVDDSHGIGVIGKSGRGVLEYFGIENFSGIYTASLGKALANSGGMIGTSTEIIEELSYYCPHLIYSTAITPQTLGGINGILDVYESEFEERARILWRYKNRISECNKNFQKAEAPINSLFCGSKEKALTVSKILFENKILSTPFVEPSVPKETCVVRLIANAGLTNEQVEKACDVLCGIS